MASGATPRDYKPLILMAKRCPTTHEYGLSTLKKWADFDANMLAERRDTIDALLVFGGNI